MTPCIQISSDSSPTIALVLWVYHQIFAIMPLHNSPLEKIHTRYVVSSGIFCKAVHLFCRGQVSDVFAFWGDVDWLRPTCWVFLQLRFGGWKETILTHCCLGLHSQPFFSSARRQSDLLVHLFYKWPLARTIRPMAQQSAGSIKERLSGARSERFSGPRAHTAVYAVNLSHTHSPYLPSRTHQPQ